MVSPIGPNETGETKSPVSKLVWFIGIAALSGSIVACVAYALRGLLFL